MCEMVEDSLFVAFYAHQQLGHVGGEVQAGVAAHEDQPWDGFYERAFGHSRQHLVAVAEGAFEKEVEVFAGEVHRGSAPDQVVADYLRFRIDILIYVVI